MPRPPRSNSTAPAPPADVVSVATWVNGVGFAQPVVSWREAGATHLSVNTMHAGLKTVDEHIGALRELAELLL